MTVTSRGQIMLAVAGIAVAGLVSACGTSSTTAPTSSPSAPASSPAASASGLQEFRAVATGPLAHAVQADALQLNSDAANHAAAEADSRKLAADLVSWANALRAVPVPAQTQATKNQLLQGLGQMHTGVTEFANGLRSNNTALVSKGQADVQSGVTTISQAAGQVH
jgi:hypothetical protein